MLLRFCALHALDFFYWLTEQINKQRDKERKEKSAKVRPRMTPGVGVASESKIVLNLSGNLWIIAKEIRRVLWEVNAGMEEEVCA